MMHKIETANAPAAIGPYSQGTAGFNLVFISGQLPIVPESGTIPEGIEKQAEQAIRNLGNILESAGSSLNMVFKTTVFLRDLDDFSCMNKVYASAFSGRIFPARSTVQVARLPKDALIEIEAIAWSRK
jgi:2-iminobutanoate/2-iminopropanoate deaminase